MPTYLVHGFRWHRASIRIHIILQDLEDAAAEWIIAPATSITLLNSFYSMYDFLPPSTKPPAAKPFTMPEKVSVEEEHPLPTPRKLSKKNTRSISSLRGLRRKKEKENGLNETHNGIRHDRSISCSDTSKTLPSTGVRKIMSSTPERPTRFNDWSVVKLVEQYDPNDLQSASQPHAYVADYIIDISLSASVAEETVKYEAIVREYESNHAMTNSGTPATARADNSGDLSTRGMKGRTKNLGWFEKLRDALQSGESIGWYVVVCGDEERKVPSMEIERGVSSLSESESDTEESTVGRAPKSGGFRKFFKGRKNSVEE
jgi:hypothetical protein